MNTMKQTDSTNTSGSLIISESQGKWMTGWSTVDPEKIEETWYEGQSWEELLSAFRKGVTEKMKQGYKPDLEMLYQFEPVQFFDLGIIN